MSTSYYEYHKRLPTCPQCEVRPVYVKPSGVRTSACRKCKAANDALRYYWVKRGMSISNADKNRRKFLEPLPATVRVAKR